MDKLIHVMPLVIISQIIRYMCIFKARAALDVRSL